MSLFLAGKPVSAAVDPFLPINLLTRRRASLHNVPPTMSAADLPISVCYLGQDASRKLNFTVVDCNMQFEVVVGRE